MPSFLGLIKRTGFSQTSLLKLTDREDTAAGLYLAQAKLQNSNATRGGLFSIICNSLQLLNQTEHLRRRHLRET